MTITIRRLTIAAVVAAVLAAGVLAWVKWSDGRRFSETRTLLSRFPVENAIVMHIDFATVRVAGLLASSKTQPEPEYKQFLDGTGFDYRRDLDAVTASFSKSGNFFIARGRFNWQRLRDYATKQGGSCYQQLCRMPGSTPERRISFLALRNDTMALAVSTDDLAANRLTSEGAPITGAIPEAPVWLLIPGIALHDLTAVPPGMSLMLSALNSADRLVLTLGPSGNTLTAKMEATCRTKDEARILASQLRTATSKLKQAVIDDKQAQSDELIQALTGGTFEDAGARVSGQWPFSKSLIDSLTAGI